MIGSQHCHCHCHNRKWSHPNVASDWCKASRYSMHAAISRLRNQTGIRGDQTRSCEYTLEQSVQTIDEAGMKGSSLRSLILFVIGPNARSSEDGCFNVGPQIIQSRTVLSLRCFNDVPRLHEATMQGPECRLNIGKVLNGRPWPPAHCPCPPQRLFPYGLVLCQVSCSTPTM